MITLCPHHFCFCLLLGIGYKLRIRQNLNLILVANTRQDPIHLRARLVNSLLVLCILAMPLLLTGCPKNEPPPNVRIATSTRAEDASPKVVPGAVAFNGERAMAHVKKQVEIGPRIPGSPELAKTRDYILNSLKSSGLAVRQDEFTTGTPLGEKKMVNLTAEIPGESKDVIMVASHYDSKF